MSLGNNDVDGCMERIYSVRISFLMLMFIGKVSIPKETQQSKRQVYNPMTINVVIMTEIKDVHVPTNMDSF